MVSWDGSYTNITQRTLVYTAIDAGMQLVCVEYTEDGVNVDTVQTHA